MNKENISISVALACFQIALSHFQPKFQLNVCACSGFSASGEQFRRPEGGAE